MKCAKFFLVMMLSVPGVLIMLKLIADILSSEDGWWGG